MNTLIAIREETAAHYTRRAIIQELDDEMLAKAREIFADYKARGVILNDSFDDFTWTLSNQVKNVGLTLLSFEGGYDKKSMGWIGCNYCVYLGCMKAYVMFNLGELVLVSLQKLIKAFNRLTMMTSNEASLSKNYITHVIAFLQIIPGGNAERDYVIETLEERLDMGLWKKETKQRQIADFKTYLKFHEVLTDFWQIADEKQKRFYFPLYFWWNLTAILPLRPMELLLTPRDCLRVNNGENILSVRRTKLKGQSCKVSHKIAEDYEIKEYAIHNELADELRTYMETTEKMENTEIDTLFLQEPYFEYFGRKKHYSNRYYTYGMLATCLRCFYKEIAIDIGEIHLGDTRHLAMTNLIISGGSPVICKELAGHANIGISSHYYTNISNLVECITIAKYRKAKDKGANLFGSAKYPLSMPKTKVHNGFCDSESVKNGAIDDCLKVVDRDSHIGECNHCIHFYPDKQGIRLEFLNEKSGKQQVDADSKYLLQMIETVRKGLGHTEDIGAALLRLQRSSNHYGKCLWEKYTQEDSVTWQDQES